MMVLTPGLRKRLPDPDGSRLRGPGPILTVSERVIVVITNG